MMFIMPVLLACFPIEAISQLPEVAAVERDNAGGKRQVIQLCDWHWVSQEAFIADGGAAHEYPAFLDAVEAVQREQMAVLRAMKVKRIFVEGESEKTIVAYRQKIERLKSFKPLKGGSPIDEVIRAMYREDLLQVGAAGQLLIAGEIEEVLPAENHDAWLAGNPIRDGQVEIDLAANRRREAAIVRNLAVEDNAVIILGTAHHLGNLLGNSVEYVRISVKAIPCVR